MTVSGRRNARGVVDLPPHVLAGTLAAVIAGFAVAGALVGAEPSKSWFHLENEFTAPAYFSAALLLVAAGCGWFAAQQAAGRVQLAWLILAALWLAMGGDEVVGVHERFERRLGVDWQLLYLPVAAAGGAAWFVAVRGSDRPVRMLLVAGATAWVAAQTLEFLQWDSNDQRVAAFESMMIAEETLEMTGSALFLLAAYIAAPPGARRTAGEPRPERLKGRLDRHGRAVADVRDSLDAGLDAAEPDQPG